MSALEVASLFATLSLKDDMSSKLKSAKGSISGFADGIKSAGSNITELGGAMATVFGPAAAGIGLAAKSAIDFDETMTNVGAVLGKNKNDMAGLRAEILAFGSTTREGPLAVADAFYDVVGGVTDASARMAVLRASVKLAEAGNASLKGTTQALISVMNAYKFSAGDASKASDVLAQTVAMGVGSMDQFASAFPIVAGTAATVGVKFEDLGAAMAFMTTQGFSASESATRLQQAMISILKPNADMQAAMKAAGIESGSLALQQYGLAGTIQKLSGALGGNTDAMVAALGSTEAFQAAVALNNSTYNKFASDFVSGSKGMTDAAQQIQLQSTAAQFDLLKSQVEGAGIALGSALLPQINDLLTKIKPVVDDIVSWMQQNPQLTQQIVMVTLGGAALGIALTAVGTALSAIGTIIGVIASPITLLIGLIAVLIGYLASGEGGLRGGLIRAATAAQQLGQIIQYYVVGAIKAASDAINEFMGRFQGFSSAANSIGQISQGLGQGQFNIGDVARVSVQEFGRAIFGGGRASGGPVSAGSTYLVGERGPELFSPGSSGTIVPNEAMSGMNIGSITIQANSYEGGQAAADGFSQRMAEIQRRRG